MQYLKVCKLYPCLGVYRSVGERGAEIEYAAILAALHTELLANLRLVGVIDGTGAYHSSRQGQEV